MTRKVITILVLLLAAGVTLTWAAEFEHRAHLQDYLPGISCDTCHLPDADTIVPEKAICLYCHDQELVDEVALGVPRTHGPVWALNHRTEAIGDGIDCSSCHAQEYCLECHKSGFADEQGSFSNNMINVHRSDFHVSHPIAARTDQRLCASCHEETFCSDCHDDWRFRGNEIGSPSHRRSFDKGLSNTNIDLIHAGIDNSLACDICHTGASLDLHTWSIGHAREARRSLATCQACHPGGDDCLKCHSAKGGAFGFNPHPDDWDDIKGTLKKASNGRTCRKCH